MRIKKIIRQMWSLPNSLAAFNLVAVFLARFKNPQLVVVWWQDTVLYRDKHEAS